MRLENCSITPRNVKNYKLRRISIVIHTPIYLLLCVSISIFSGAIALFETMHKEISDFTHHYIKNIGCMWSKSFIRR